MFALNHPGKEKHDTLHSWSLVIPGMLLQVKTEKRHFDSVSNRHSDDILAVEVVLIGLRVPGRGEFNPSGLGQKTSTPGDPRDFRPSKDEPVVRRTLVTVVL